MGFIINPYQVQPGVPAFTGILDTYTGAAVAYSAARRLATAYTGPLIRVRRSSDNTEQDIGYTSGNVLDESALTSFVGANNGFVTTWYDQSGNGKDASQSTAAAQAQIISSGTVIKLTGTGTAKPCLDFIFGNYYSTSDISINAGQKFTSIHVDLRPFQGRGFWMSGDANPFNVVHYWEDNAYITSKNYSGSLDLIYQYYPTRVYNIVTGLSLDSNTSSSIRFNGTALSGAYTTIPGLSSNNKFNTLGRRAGGSDYTVSKVQEFILYLSDKTSTISGIEGNINTFYGVY
jgi:hypothetical protein